MAIYHLVYLILSNDVFRCEKKKVNIAPLFIFHELHNDAFHLRGFAYCTASACCYVYEDWSFISQSSSFLAVGVYSPELNAHPAPAVQNRGETCLLLIGQRGAPRKCSRMKASNENAVNPESSSAESNACSKSPAIFHCENAHKFVGGAAVRHVDTCG